MKKIEYIVPEMEVLELKQYINKFYIKYETYISYVWKFVLALITIAVINNKLGYMQPLNNIAIVLMVSLMNCTKIIQQNEYMRKDVQ